MWISQLMISLIFFGSVSGKGILSGHVDGAIVRYFFDDEGTGLSQVSFFSMVVKQKSKSKNNIQHDYKLLCAS